MRARFLGSLAVLIALSICPAVAAKYNVADSTGTLSIKGFIETNGKIGRLSPADIVAWSLTITGHGGTLTLDKVTSALTLIGPALSATEKSLVFDYGAKERSGLTFWIDTTASDGTPSLRRADIYWRSTHPKQPVAMASPGFGIAFYPTPNFERAVRDSDFNYEIHQFLGRTKAMPIGTVP